MPESAREEWLEIRGAPAALPPTHCDSACRSSTVMARTYAVPPFVRTTDPPLVISKASGTRSLQVRAVDPALGGPQKPANSDTRLSRRRARPRMPTCRHRHTYWHEDGQEQQQRAQEGAPQLQSHHAIVLHRLRMLRTPLSTFWQRRRRGAHRPEGVDAPRPMPPVMHSCTLSLRASRPVLTPSVARLCQCTFDPAWTVTAGRRCTAAMHDGR
jgi:hypothetical protein